MNVPGGSLDGAQAKSASAGPAGAFSQPAHRPRVAAGESCSLLGLGAANGPAHVSSQLESEYFWFPVSSCRPDFQAVGAFCSSQENLKTALVLQELTHAGPW